tara:strand:- start:8160 stop:8342 length:183 start_codon:yes stop_codon:yes gene_type:complete
MRTKKLYCYAKDYNKVRKALTEWNVNFKEKDGYFKIDNQEAMVVAEKLCNDKLLLAVVTN